MMVEKNVVPVVAQAGILSEKVPNFIESGTPCAGDLSDTDPAAHGRKLPSRDGFDVDLVTHRIYRIAIRGRSTVKNSKL